MKKSIDAKKVMLAHSEAKIEFFKKYLERYLRILYGAPYIDEINIFDVFCGTGIYDNDKKGSPIVAFDTIQKLREEFGYDKRINLFVNDSSKRKVASVQNYISEQNKEYCNVIFRSEDADKMFEDSIKIIDSQSRNARNLIFIDPYGYKEIKKSTLQQLLKNQRTEIILFLPIAQMHRFTSTALESDERAYLPLREFVLSFFEGEHAIKQSTVKAIDYIHYLTQALRFGTFFTTSYYIKRDESNYYALFFISPRAYGIEKILEVKWQLDEMEGRGFKQPKQQHSFLEIFEKDEIQNENYDRLEKILAEFLKSPKNNNEIYEIVLRNEFRIKYANEVFRNWQDERKSFKVIETATGEEARKGTFFLNWENFRDNTIKATFELKS
jgi:three-Cys-motif partner protein